MTSWSKNISILPLSDLATSLIWRQKVLLNTGVCVLSCTKRIPDSLRVTSGSTGSDSGTGWVWGQACIYLCSEPWSTSILGPIVTCWESQAPWSKANVYVKTTGKWSWDTVDFCGGGGGGEKGKLRSQRPAGSKGMRGLGSPRWRCQQICFLVVEQLIGRLLLFPVSSNGGKPGISGLLLRH